MYLSNVKRIAGDYYKVHQYLRGIFPEGTLRFRDELRTVIVLSDNAPDLSKFEGTYKPIVTVYSSGIELSFKVRANAVKTNNGKRTPVEDVSGWIKTQAEKGGFELKEVIITKEGNRFFFKGDKIGTLNSVYIEGRLVVKDTEKFDKVLQLGIGKARGLGYGLVTVG